MQADTSPTRGWLRTLPRTGIAALLAVLVLVGCEAGSSDPDDADDADEMAEDTETPEPGEPLEVELIGGEDIDVSVDAAGYAPESDLLIALHGDGIAPVLYLLDPEGEVQQGWRITNREDETLLDRRMLPNGNIMFTIRGDGVFEMTPEGEIAWEFRTADISHHAEILPNGNVLLVDAVCDCVREIDYGTHEEIWSWDAHQAFPDYDDDANFRSGPEYNIQSHYAAAYEEGAEWPNTWAHANYAQVLENDHVVVSLRNFDTVVEVNRDGETVWSYGPGIIKHQHTTVDLEDGTMLIFDNGNHRAYRFDRATGEVLWSYDDLDSAIMGDVNLLHDGNYKVVDSVQHRVVIVSPEGEPLWEVQVSGDEIGNGIYRAHLPDLEN